jgi:hypothetical protein
MACRGLENPNMYDRVVDTCLELLLFVFLSVWFGLIWVMISCRYRIAYQHQHMHC